MVSFAGGSLQHGGTPITKGHRYILAVFLYITKINNVLATNDDNVNSNVSPVQKKQKIDFSVRPEDSHLFSFQF